MNDALKEFLNSGKRIIGDTKQPKSQQTKKQVPLSESLSEPVGDAHHVFVKRTVSMKPKKSEILDDFKKFVEQAEKEL